MQRYRLAILFTLLVATLFVTSGCDDAGANGSTATIDNKLAGKLVISGSSTLAPLVGEMAKRFEAMHPTVRVDVQTGGSSRGIADVKRGLVDIGMVSRTIKPDDGDLNVHRVAMDGVCLLVHRDNPLAALTDEQVVNIYTGKVRNWLPLGGNDTAITVINKAQGRATLEVFLRHFQLDSQRIKASVIIGENQQVIRTIASDVNAIGYVSIGTAEYEAKHGSPIRLLPLNSVEASATHVRDGSFGMSRPLSLVTQGKLTPLAAAFISFAQSHEVDDLIEADYFIPPSRD